MKQLYSVWLAVVAIVLTWSVHANDFDSTYKLGAGDTISILVYGEEELSMETLLSDSGRINYPFLGQIMVKGLTIEDLKDTIQKGLKGDYLIDPSVHVSIVEYRPFFINGEVKQPGGYAFQPGLTVNKAVALAGGFTNRASKSSIYVTSSDAPNRKPKPVKLDTSIMPGDIITIEQSFF
ncbi:polysaccharide biosynthesis/export family protein [Motilimonas eburnea]|uniref:polysaccharide biosynthesis/export family protein n=1 Tax=Motilimonas eburnea TaxID=1737488 RepID=UPI001E36E610|nr:polysaccharide biosynthesis/export family protein [Motilimonas eburnea]MCE2570633.1 polysaccharide export protein [Motilimonas eburnea]